MTERAPRDRCRLPAPSRCLDGRVATSVATAARIAAADSGLPRGRRALSGALHMDAQVRATQPAERRLQSASLVPRPDSPPTASSDERVAPRTASPQTGHQEDHEPKIPTRTDFHPTTRLNHRTQDSQQKEEKPPRAAQDPPTLTAATKPKNTHTWRPARPYIPPGFLLRPPSSSCGKLREKGRYPFPTLSPPPLAARGGRGNRYMAQA